MAAKRGVDCVIATRTGSVRGKILAYAEDEADDDSGDRKADDADAR